MEALEALEALEAFEALVRFSLWDVRFRLWTTQILQRVDACVQLQENTVERCKVTDTHTCNRHAGKRHVHTTVTGYTKAKQLRERADPRHEQPTQS